MKKMIKCLFAVCTVCMIVILTGCSGASKNGGGGGGSSSDKSPAGTYTLYSMRDAGTDEGDASEYYAEDQGVSGTLTLNQDGTGKYVFMGQTVELTYDINKKTITANGEEYTFEYGDGVLRWMMEDKIHTFKKE